MAPERNEQVHRHKHELPKQKEQEEVQGEKHPDDAAQDEEHITMEESGPRLNLSPRGDHCHQPQKGGQEHKYETKAVQTQMQADTPAGNPGSLSFNEPPSIAGHRTLSPNNQGQCEIETQSGH